MGGARPKFSLRLDDGAALLVKFTPPLDTPTGRRWADLLRVEALAAKVLREAGVPAVEAEYVEIDGRGYLEIERFDRIAGGGRAGHVTLYNLGVARVGEVNNPPAVVDALVRDRVLSAHDATLFSRIDRFSRAIANNDAHQGNYGLSIDDDGNATLSPAYDVVPMAFAPRHDELPDRWVESVGEVDAETRTLVERLAREMERDGGFERAFVEVWGRVTSPR
ncbi:MAG: HipA domain-containing protein [Polyangiales bacterium]